MKILQITAEHADIRISREDLQKLENLIIKSEGGCLLEGRDYASLSSLMDEEVDKIVDWRLAESGFD